ncbi:DUF3429 domain-containing protein [Sandarakinorhabdus sp.]|uniref:DUF3429 domain-containing protein n=1 Tax=Sandarakinorhabdus sp. TaxID=1916663 RepID=UPI00286DAB2D|nr:DUF3429 domain-containing protein [Sandarakinorhabdus sp.]
MTMHPIPVAVLGYGLAGLVPFLAPPVIAMLVPAWAPMLMLVVTGYAALILSFLGGARWGLEVAGPQPRLVIITLAMVPTLAALAVLFLAPSGAPQLLALAACLAAHLLWDATAAGLPGWYPRLRAILTAGALTGLGAMAAIAA